MPRDTERHPESGADARSSAGKGPSLVAGVAIVAAGGALGSLARWAVAIALGEQSGTLAVNVLGAALLGAYLARALGGGDPAGRWALLVATGFCSSFTTYSTFALGAVTALPWPGVRYVVLTYGLGIAAALAGRWVVRRRRGWSA